MSDAPKTRKDHPPFGPEVTPQLVPVPEIEREEKVPIDVINGALEELRRRERGEDVEDGGVRTPTIH